MATYVSSQNIQVKRRKQAENCWRSKGELISDVVLLIPPHGYARVGRPVMNYNKEGWKERHREGKRKKGRERERERERERRSEREREMVERKEKDKEISVVSRTAVVSWAVDRDVLLWTSTHRRASIGQQVRAYSYQFYVDTGC